MCNKKEKERNIRDTAERLYKLRYLGDTENIEYLYPRFLKEDESEFCNFGNNFIMAGIPTKREIFFTKELLNELEKISDESNVEVSTLINCYLLQMLERNKRTIEHTKARKVYVKNTLYEQSEYIQDCENIDELEKNIFDEDFIQYKEISFKNGSYDESIYIKNVLLNNGYSLEQINEIEKEEKSKFGRFISEEGEEMKPIVIKFYLEFEVKALNFEYTAHRFIPTRLGLHYILFKKKKEFNSYEKIEEFLNENLKGDKKIWDLYKEYLMEKLK